MKKKLACTIIVLFWLGMMAYFLREEVFPPASEGYRPQLEDLVEEKERKEVFTILFNEKEIGEIQTTAKRNADGTYSLINDTSVNLGEQIRQQGLGKNIQRTLNFIGLPGLEFQMKSQVDVDSNFQLKKIAFELASSSLDANISGSVEDNSLKIDIRQGEDLKQLELPHRRTETIPQGFIPFDRMTDLRIGKHWKMRYINPITKTTEVFDARVVDTEQVVVSDKVYDAFVVKTQSSFVSIKTWVAADGTVLKVKLPFGIEIKREDVKSPNKSNSLPKKKKELK